ncbi:PAS domain-containing protein [filamentous cyanobacterium LEGE 11480]|uniref:histidine kinase n=1 Tax=Romeriopsis navalis LEGE 11480 TaxID=2777977 RepID=A0A928VL22_9CYAN|nr:cell wall metabolism sensor histidine kinase WalK [Romeriopsis navalis]MBE9028495.1 PAS domain-containing protein [Romeriopsis navalis LEGE 11480]
MVTIFKTLRDLLERWWADFNLQTRLMAIATLVVSVVMSGLTFWAVNTIQADARLNDTRFGRDLGLLLAANVTPMIAENNLTEVARFSHRFYSGTASVRYIIYADPEGKILFGIPFSDSEVKSSLSIQRRIQLPSNFADRPDDPMMRQHLTPNGVVTDVFVPLSDGGNYLGVLAIGTNPNPATISSSNLTRDVTTAVFVSIWVMVILGAVFNALTVTKPIKELVNGVENIAQGNFKQRVDSPLSGEFKGLMSGFNTMAEKLERYEEQNIEELTAEKAKLDTLVSTIADGAVLLDPEFHVVLANSTARRIFAWENQVLAGENALDCFPAVVKEAITKPLQKMASGDTTKSAEFQIVLKDPVKRTIRILLNSVLDTARENAKGIALTIQDITREAELNEAKSQFISNVSHELRTPLFNIKSFIETLYEYGDALEPEQQREFLETANRETDRLTRLVNDVLDLSRLESGKAYAFDAVDLHQAVDQTLRTYQLNAKDKGITLRQEIAPGLPTIWGNYDLLLQVLANLIGNALKFTHEGTVAIRAYCLDECDLDEQAQMVRVEIADTGLGIDVEDQVGVFERFFRAENRVHTLEGTGLGLSIVRNILEKHGTQASLVSEVGTGTTFWFDLKVFHPATVIGNMSLDELAPNHSTNGTTSEPAVSASHIASTN